MATSLVIAIYHDKDTGNVEYLFVNPGKYANEEDTLVRLETTPSGVISKEEARKRLKEQVPTKFDNKDAQMQSPIVVRSPSEKHETWKSKVYIPNIPWGFVKGGCNLSETPVECAKREFREETTLKIEDLSRFKELGFNIPDLNVYQLDLNQTEKRNISIGIENKIKNLKSGEIFDYEWSHPMDKPVHIKFNRQSQLVLNLLIERPLVPGTPPPAVSRFPSLETEAAPAPAPGRYIPPHLRAPTTAAAPAPASTPGKYIPPHRRGGKTRRRKNGKRRRQTKKHI